MRRVKRASLFNAMVPYRFLFPKLLVFAVFLLVPVAWTLALSLQTGSYLSGLRSNGFRNYEAILGDELFWSALRNSVLYAILIIPTCIILGLALAGLLNRRIRLRPLFGLLLIIPTLASSVAASIIWANLLQTDGGYVNGLLGAFGLPQVNWLGSTNLVIIVNSAIEAWRSIPFYAILFLAGMQSIPSAVYEAASIDGVVGVKAFRMITVPLLRPIIAFGVVMATIWTLQIFDTPYVVTRGGPVGASTPLTLHIYRVAFAGDNMGLAAAMSVALLAVILVVAVIELRAFRKEVQF
jgi:ABC-type sugar transport system permease subunit